MILWRKVKVQDAEQTTDREDHVLDTFEVEGIKSAINQKFEV